MNNGYAGKILRINLTTHHITTLPTARYARWGGGHGMGSAIFWDLVKDKTISGFDPANVITIMTSPLGGTLAPAASGRTEMQGIGVQSTPEWFTRSNFGGRFGPMLKYAGWDGIVLEGRSKKPVWLDIRNDKVVIRDGGNLWGMDTWKTQEEIWKSVGWKRENHSWFPIGDPENDERTTQQPAVLAIGPAGENLCRVACLVHDAGNAAGQGGFGGVWGSKNLKAVSVIGTGSIAIADPEGLLNARLWSKKFYAADATDPERYFEKSGSTGPAEFASPFEPIVVWQQQKQRRLQACTGCHSGCRTRTGNGMGNESSCMESFYYTPFDIEKHSGPLIRTAMYLLEKVGQNAAANYVSSRWGNQTDASYKATDLLQQYGINAFEMEYGLNYMRALYKMGELGPGKPIDCDLDFNRLGEMDFAEKLTKMVAHRKGIGDDIAEGFYRAAKKWGRLDQDIASGLLPYPYWGLPDHYDPRAELEWGYGSVMGDRDINEHDFNFLYRMATISKLRKKEPPISAEAVVNICVNKMKPLAPDPMMLDYGSDNMYSKNIAKLVSWHRHYTRFWKQSAMFCDLRYADFFNKFGPDNKGLTGEGEPRFYNAVTGADMSFVDGMTLGRKIWNLDQAIWTLQGRHRNMVEFAPYIHNKPLTDSPLGLYCMPARKDGKWEYQDVSNRYIEKAGFEEWKTHYYRQEGWDQNTGYPTLKTLQSLGLGPVAEELTRHKKLGKG